MTKNELIEKVDFFIKNENCDVIVNYVYREVLKNDNIESIINNFSHLKIMVNEDEALDVKNLFCNYINKELPEKCLQGENANSNYYLLKTMKLLMPFHQNAKPLYSFTSIEQLIKDFKLNRSVVCYYLIEAVRYRSGIMDTSKEIMFSNTYFAFSSSMKDIENELISFSDYDELLKKSKLYSEELFNNYIESIKDIVPF